MKHHLYITNFVFPVFAAGTFATLIVGMLTGAMEYFYLSMLVGFPFLLGLVLAARTRSDLVVLFSLTAFISGWLSPLGFFLERDKFTYSGFAAVRDFNFSALEFIGFYLPIIAGYFIILEVVIILSPDAWSRAGQVVTMEAAPSSHAARPRQTIAPTGSRWVRLLFIVMIMVFAAINWWMFANSIGITGIDPPPLPFKLSGSLYYLARFVFPALLTFLLTRFRPTTFDLMLLVTYACFAALTSVSKTVLFLLFTPALISSFSNKRYMMLAMTVLLLVVFYPVVDLARNFVYVFDAGISIRNVDFSLMQVLSGTLFDFTMGDVLSSPLAIVGRIGGGQDVALAAQYDNALTAGPLLEFVRLYIFDFFDLASAAQTQMYDYQVTVMGTSTGDGGFFAHMLLVGGRSPPMLLLVSAYEGLVLAIGNATCRRLMALGISREIVLFYAILFCILFFVLSIPLWLNVFLIVTFFGSRTRLFAAFVRSRQQTNIASHSQRLLPL